MKKIIFALIAAAAATSFQVQAATFDFQAYADGSASNGEVFVNSLSNSGLGEYGYSSYSVEATDGIKVTATGNNGDSPAFAYLDSGNAGLGVCKALTTGHQCTPSSDDNVTSGETLVLTFNQEVSFTDMTLRNGGHGTTFGEDSTFQLTIDNVLFGDVLLGDLKLFDWGSGTVFEFFNSSGEANPDVFYIDSMTVVSAVPLPAAVWLFGSALLGFTGFRKFKSKS